MKSIGILMNTGKEQVTDLLPRLSAEAERLGVELSTCQRIEPVPSGWRVVAEDQFESGIEALVTLGGDGTLLQAARLLKGKEIPVLGVNLGRLGFLTSATEAQLETGLRALVSGHYQTSKRVMLEAFLNRATPTTGSSRRLFALNDIVLGWGQSTRIIALDVTINDEAVTTYRCDGIIVSTPTGSTGHSLSAGGPILHPDTNALLMNVICPHTLSARPLVMPEDARISITVAQSGKDLLLSVDGQDADALGCGDTITVRKSARSFHLVHLDHYHYFSVLRHKLQWSGSTH
ncbi:MAG: NAD(+)/NADH kinase [Kiritimatiellia bacterium]